ncbi:MAG: hypothetical protein RL042_598 [Nitrospirota bacterium]
MALESEPIVADIKRVGTQLGLRSGAQFAFAEYRQAEGRFTKHQIQDGGLSWKYWCERAGFTTKGTPPVPTKDLIRRYADAYKELGRKPKASERKRYGLRFRPRIDPMGTEQIESLEDLHQLAIQCGEIAESPKAAAPAVGGAKPAVIVSPDLAGHIRSEQPPPIPRRSKRKTWERIDVPGFPFAPHDENGVVALFAILCACGTLPYEILQLNSGKGIDAICWHRQELREVHIELKHVLRRSSWNHLLDEIDAVVCWRNSFPSFQRPVVVLEDVVRQIAG